MFRRGFFFLRFLSSIGRAAWIPRRISCPRTVALIRGHDGRWLRRRMDSGRKRRRLQRCARIAPRAHRRSSKVLRWSSKARDQGERRFGVFSFFIVHCYLSCLMTGWNSSYSVAAGIDSVRTTWNRKGIRLFRCFFVSSCSFSSNWEKWKSIVPCNYVWLANFQGNVTSVIVYRKQSFVFQGIFSTFRFIQRLVTSSALWFGCRLKWAWSSDVMLDEYWNIISLLWSFQFFFFSECWFLYFLNGVGRKNFWWMHFFYLQIQCNFLK